jgi:hypothetical protein
MGELAQFLRFVREHPGIKDQFFDPTFLHSVGRNVEKNGFDEAKLFLWDSQQMEHMEKQALALLDIVAEMEVIESFRKNPALGGHIIRNIHKVKK